jgi:hypothetical protein
MFYKKLEKILAHKDHCMAKDNEGEYCVFSSVKDENGDFRWSGWWTSKKTAKARIGRYSGMIENDINEIAKDKNWQIVEMWDNPKKRFHPGEKVKIADNAKELCEEADFRADEMEEMIGKILEIKNLYGSDYRVWTEDKEDWWFFPHSALIPAFEEEEITIKVSKKSLEALKKCGIKIIKE